MNIKQVDTVLANLRQIVLKTKKLNFFSFQIHEKHSEYFSKFLLFSTTKYVDHEDQMLKISKKFTLFLIF